MSDNLKKSDNIPADDYLNWLNPYNLNLPIGSEKEAFVPPEFLDIEGYRPGMNLREINNLMQTIRDFPVV